MVESGENSRMEFGVDVVGNSKNVESETLEHMGIKDKVFFFFFW